MSLQEECSDKLANLDVRRLLLQLGCEYSWQSSKLRLSSEKFDQSSQLFHEHYTIAALQCLEAVRNKSKGHTYKESVLAEYFISRIQYEYFANYHRALEYINSVVRFFLKTCHSK